jgi:hypothetical protein
LFVTKSSRCSVQLDPKLSQWNSIVCAAQGDVFDKDLSEWHRETRISIGLPVEAQLIVVGHQPEFFHPGILAKFIAGDIVAQKSGGDLVHLVVDHHVGTSNSIAFPERLGEKLVIRDVLLTTFDEEIAMKDQDRVTPVDGIDPFAEALINAKGDNAAMQVASATDILMSPWANVDHLIGSTALLQTAFGLRVIEEMHRDPDRCRETYNEAVANHPDCVIPMLSNDELPVWYGNRNSRFGSPNDSVQPRALLLTLLARVSLGDLFIHGTGGMLYDKIMEQWVSSWLGITPCPATLATATMHLDLQQQTIEDARSQYFSPDGETQKRDQFLDSIDRSPYKSSTRQEQFQAMHDWLSSINDRPDESQFRNAERIASRRDWAFSLYPDEMLDALREAIKGN